MIPKKVLLDTQPDGVEDEGKAVALSHVILWRQESQCRLEEADTVLVLSCFVFCYVTLFLLQMMIA